MCGDMEPHATTIGNCPDHNSDNNRWAVGEIFYEEEIRTLAYYRNNRNLVSFSHNVCALSLVWVKFS